jgi:tricorn protease
VAVPLRDDVPSPLAARNDDEEVEEKDHEHGDTKEHDGEEHKDDDKDDEEDEDKPDPVEIDLDDFERRLIVLPPDPANYRNLIAVSGKLLYLDHPRTGSADEDSAIRYYDLEERETKTVLDAAGGFVVSADGKKLLAFNDGKFAIVDVKAKQKMDKPLATGKLEMEVDPAAEWRQIFTDVWRLERDFFYDPDMHGVNWNEMRKRYGALLEDAVTRWDVDFVIGELIAELNASHAYRGGGDSERAPRRRSGLLGVDFVQENGVYKIDKILDGAVWDSEVRSPLNEPGLDVDEGDYLLAVNGTPLDPTKDPWAAFQGLANQTVSLTVNDKPETEGSREVLVETLASESRLRNLAWIESKRKRVEEASGGRIGYIYVPDTTRRGQTELVRMFVPQHTAEALIIDERFNSGGQIPDRFIELLNRPLIHYWGVRDGRDWQWPPIAHAGPKVMLINQWSGSGGDAFPYYFKQAGLGPLIGKRTWGGLIGISGAPGLVDGGVATVPTFGSYGMNGEWIIEGHGVDPDIEVVDDPALMVDGGDPQLERAIEETLRLLKEKPFKAPGKPGYPDRSGY